MVCAICVAPILAAAGAGGFGSSALTDKQKKRNRILLWIGIISTLLSLGFFIYWLYKKNTPEGCAECEAFEYDNKQEVRIIQTIFEKYSKQLKKINKKWRKKIVDIYEHKYDTWIDEDINHIINITNTPHLLPSIILSSLDEGKDNAIFSLASLIKQLENEII